jgi:hypothetical protein
VIIAEVLSDIEPVLSVLCILERVLERVCTTRGNPPTAGTVNGLGEGSRARKPYPNPSYPFWFTRGNTRTRAWP